VRLLRENDVSPTVVDLNMDAVRALRESGVDAIYGDAIREDVLVAAGIAQAGSLILGSAGMASSAEVIRAARVRNPGISVLARATYLRDVPALTAAGATRVYSGEAEVALAFVEDILDTLGATAEQFDRERDRAHAELNEQAPSCTCDSVVRTASMHYHFQVTTSIAASCERPLASSTRTSVNSRQQGDRGHTTMGGRRGGHMPCLRRARALSESAHCSGLPLVGLPAACAQRHLRP